MIMNVEMFTPKNSHSAPVTLSESAINYFEGKLKNSPDHVLRLSTKASGCTGYAYVLDVVAKPQAHDTVIKASDKLTLAVALDAMALVKDTEIDYVKEGVNGVIKFNNPNVVNECGCGESFNVS